MHSLSSINVFLGFSSLHPSADEARISNTRAVWWYGVSNLVFYNRLIQSVLAFSVQITYNGVEKIKE
jgi:hypothetical protein